MKKIILTIILFFFNYELINAAEFKWSKVSVNIDDTVFYVSKNSVVEVADYKYYWMMADYGKQLEGPDLSTITLNKVNCSTYENKYINFTAYDEHMGKGNFIMDFLLAEETPEESIWNKFDPKIHAQGKVVEYVCRLR